MRLTTGPAPTLQPPSFAPSFRRLITTQQRRGGGKLQRSLGPRRAGWLGGPLSAAATQQ